MTVNDFCGLDENAQAETTWNGTFLANRNEGAYQVLLYQVYDFCVQVYYHTEDNAIHKFQPFDSTFLGLQ